MKHTTPCGLAIGTVALDAYRKALACDPVSAFGSVIAFTVPVDDATADAVSSLFVECIVAPEFSDGAVEILGRKKNLRVLEGTRGVAGAHAARLQARARRRARAGARAGRDRRRGVEGRDEAAADRRRSIATCCSRGARWRRVKSNAIVLARDGATIGIGAGQMSRVDAAFLAVHKARVRRPRDRRRGARAPMRSSPSATASTRRPRRA